MRLSAKAEPAPGDQPALRVARNDIHAISRWTLLQGLPAYLKLRWFSGVARMRYVPATFESRG